jgi:hypothetical protein
VFIFLLVHLPVGPVLCLLPPPFFFESFLAPAERAQAKNRLTGDLELFGSLIYFEFVCFEPVPSFQHRFLLLYEVLREVLVFTPDRGFPLAIKACSLIPVAPVQGLLDWRPRMSLLSEPS